VLVTIAGVSTSGANRSSSNVSTVVIEETLPLNVKDFPAIKFWYKNQRHKENGRRQNARQNNIGRSSRHASQDENLAFWFLQNVDGTIVDSDIVTSLQAEAKLIWSGMCNEYGPIGLPWSSVPAKRCLEFWLKLECVYPFLRLYANHYKADAVATRDYTPWYNALFRKRRRATKPVHVQKSRQSGSDLCQVTQLRIEDEDEDDNAVEEEVNVREESDNDEEDKEEADGEEEDKADGEAEDKADGEEEDKANREAEDKADGEEEEEADGEAEDKADEEEEDKADGRQKTRPTKRKKTRPTGRQKTRPTKRMKTRPTKRLSKRSTKRSTKRATKRSMTRS
jgi:hypothetical protein